MTDARGSGDRDADVEAALRAFRLGRHVHDGDHPQAGTGDREEAGIRKALDKLIERGWQRPEVGE